MHGGGPGGNFPSRIARRIFFAYDLHPAVREIDVGQVIAGKYELVRLLGKGAMGAVWLAKHESLGGEFAIKVVDTASEVATEEGAAGRFQLEAQLSARLSRKTRHIVSVSDHGEEDGFAYLVMELLVGESLETRLSRSSLTAAETAAVVAQVGRALGIAHAEGVFHRDLKPANVFLSRDEDGRLLVKLFDFGIARTTGPVKTRSAFATGKDMVLGTPSYMSPEQARGLATLDHRCDLWALAVLSYECLAHRIPWDGESVEDLFLNICTFNFVPLGTVRPDLPRETNGFYERAFATKLDDRFASADELVAAFVACSNATDADIEAASGPSPRPSSGALAIAPAAREGAPPRPPSDPMVAVRDQVELTRRTRKKRTRGTWILAVAAALATMGLTLVGVLHFREGEMTAQATTTPPTATGTPSPSPPPSPSPAPSPTPPSSPVAREESPAPRSSTLDDVGARPSAAKAAPRATTRFSSGKTAGPSPLPTAQGTGTPASAPPSPAAVAPAAPTPKPPGSHDKGAVF